MYVYDVDKVYLFNVPRDKELIEYITEFIVNNGIKTGLIMIIGAVYDPVIGYYDHVKDQYIEVKLKGHYELVSGIGNISLREGKPIPHIHVVLGGRNGETYGGHLLSAKVFVAETMITSLTGPVLERERVTNTLWLWP